MYTLKLIPELKSKLKIKLVEKQWLLNLAEKPLGKPTEKLYKYMKADVVLSWVS